MEDHSLKVAHLVTVQSGGAYNAAKRISDALVSQGVDSKLITLQTLYQEKGWKYQVLYRIQRKIFDRIPGNRAVLKQFFSNDKGFMPLLRQKDICGADVIHFHWVSDCFVSNASLRRMLKRNKKIVWTLHDMHPFTGGCHYDNMCGKYEEECRKCPLWEGRKDTEYCYKNQQRKKHVMQNQSISVVGCSRWITECARKSSIMRTLNCSTIPNCIDVDKYFPMDQAAARTCLRLDCVNKKIILFGACNSTSDERKGYKYLVEALRQLNPQEYMCLVFGGEVQQIGDFEIASVGRLEDDISLNMLYNCADVFVAPSLQENLANTVMESMSCGTPVAAFDVGGMSDMITHKKNGFLAKPFESSELAEGIKFCCRQDGLAYEARKHVEEHYTYAKVGELYKDRYLQMLR